MIGEAFRFGEITCYGIEICEIIYFRGAQWIHELTKFIGM